MDKKEICNFIKSNVKSYSYGYNIVLDVALVAAGIKLKNKKLIIGAVIATAGTAISIYDTTVAPIVKDIKEEIELRRTE